MNIIKKDITYYTKMMAENKPFSFSRYGDGEFFCMLGRKGHNTDGHRYFPEMGELLARTLFYPHSDPYIYSIGTIPRRNKEVNNFMSGSSIHLDWHYASVFVEAAIHGTLHMLLEALKRKRILYVGPGYLCQGHMLAGLFPVVDYVTVPTRDCYLQMGNTKRQILEVLDKNDIDLIGFSSGMMTEILMWELWGEVEEKTMIDFGSLWDGYAGRPTRSYHYRIPETTVRHRI